MQIFVTKDYQEMSEAAADMIVDLVEEKPGCVLGLATGSTPEGLYAEIAKRHEAEDIDFSRVATFNLDEYRGLPADHEQSYHYFMQKHLFSKINVRPENTHVPNGANPDAQAACDAYEASILLAGGVDRSFWAWATTATSASTSPRPNSRRKPTASTLRNPPLTRTAACSIPPTKCPARHTPGHWHHHGRQPGAHRGERQKTRRKSCAMLSSAP